VIDPRFTGNAARLFLTDCCCRARLSLTPSLTS
jgi:hypothetical protein